MALDKDSIGQHLVGIAPAAKRGLMVLIGALVDDIRELEAKLVAAVEGKSEPTTQAAPPAGSEPIVPPAAAATEPAPPADGDAAKNADASADVPPAA